MIEVMTPEGLLKSWESTSMDVFSWLESMGLYRKNVIRDSNSLFRSVSELVYNTQRQYKTVRRQCVQFIEEFGKDKFGLMFELTEKEYVEKMSMDQTYGGFNEVAVMSQIYQRDIVIVDSCRGPNLDYCKGYAKIIYIFHQANIQHFDILLPINLVTISALCQSIIYRIIYENVFKLKDVEYATDRMLSEGTYGNTITSLSDNADKKKKYSLNKSYSNGHEECTFNKNMLPFPYRVARGISSNVFKNIDFDIWVETKREKEMLTLYNDGMSLQVGVKCFCKLSPDQITPYNGYIQDIKTNGPCEVYVEELGSKVTVEMSQLEPLPLTEAKSWYSSNKKGNLKYLRKSNTKRRKSIDPTGFYSNLMVKTTPFKTRLIEKQSEEYKDTNNNVSKDTYSSCSTLEWELNKYTRIDYYTFKPYTMEYVTLPFTVEQNGNVPNANRDSGNHNRQPLAPFNFPTPVTSSSNGSPSAIQYLNGNSDVNGNSPTFTPTSASPVTSSSIVYGNTGVMCPGNSPYSTLPVYCMPSVPIQSARPVGPPNMPYTPRPLSSYTVGVNLSAQRSMNPNGSDLPFNDVTTLRFFFNLGIEWMQTFGCVWPAMPPPPLMSSPPGPHNNNNYYYPQSTTPNQLALDLQSLNMDDAPNNQAHDSNRNYNNGNNHLKGNGPKFGEFRNGRGVSYNQRFKKNDGPHERNTFTNKNNFNRGQYSYNNKKGNPRSGNFNDAGGSNVDKKDQVNENETSPTESPTLNPNAPIISYPPPPFYRLPFYPLEGDMPLNYPPNYTPYATNSEEFNSQCVDPACIPPPGYVPYIPPPPVFYPSSNMTTYYPPNYTAPNSENSAK